MTAQKTVSEDITLDNEVANMSYNKCMHIALRVLRIILIVTASLVLIAVVFIYVGAHAKGRVLTETEVALATSIYGDDIDLAQVRLAFDSVYSTFAPVTLGNTIHVSTTWSHLDNTDDLAGRPSAHHVLIHELAHVSQYQHGGWSYLVSSIYAQTLAFISKGSRNEAYRWEERINDNTSFADWNPEEQAQGISDFEYYVSTGNSWNKQQVELTKKLACVVPVLKNQYCKNVQ